MSPKPMYRSSKKHIIALLSLTFCLSLLLIQFSWGEDPFPKPRGLVNDYANVIPAQQEQKMNVIAGELLEKSGVPVVVVTMPDIGGADYTDYANRLYEAWGIGKKGKDEGVLLFVTIKERKMRIEVGYGLEGILPDGLAGEIRDRYMVPYLKENQFGEGLLNGILVVSQVIAKSKGIQLTGQAPARAPKKKRSRSGFAAFFPIILVLFFMFSSRRRRGSWLFFLPLLMGGGQGSRHGGGLGGGFGGFGGGFGGFGGGMSGGGGAGGGF